MSSVTLSLEGVPVCLVTTATAVNSSVVRDHMGQTARPDVSAAMAVAVTLRQGPVSADLAS